MALKGMLRITDFDLHKSDGVHAKSWDDCDKLILGQIFQLRRIHRVKIRASKKLLINDWLKF